MKIWLVTGNEYKYRVVKQALAGGEIGLERSVQELPELQAEGVGEVARFSALWAVEVLNKPVLVNDSGYFIESLGGFPGPLVKQVNNWFTTDDWLRLLMGKADRRVRVDNAFAVCVPGGEPVVEVVRSWGNISEEARGRKTETPLHEVFVPEGFEVTQAEIEEKEMIGYWIEKLKIKQVVERLVAKAYQSTV